VTGRGPIAAIRVGNQPYGILLTSNFSKWTYHNQFLAEDPFDDKVRNVLLHLQVEWAKFKGQLGHIAKGSDPSATLMQVLGLQPASADFYHRVAYSYDSIKNIAQLSKSMALRSG